MPEETPWLQSIEEAIVERLKAKITGIQIEALPEKPFNNVHPKGAILVMLAGINPGKTLDMFTSIQEATLSYEVYLKSRSLRDHTGLYPLISQTIDALLGWRPNQAKPLRLEKAFPTGYNDGEWGFSLTFSTETVLVPCQEDPDADVPPMTNISFKNCGNCGCEEEGDCEC